MSNPHNYTVGWICAIETEYVAAQVFLDEEHDRPEYVSPNDNNDYALGRIGKHNTVIAVLPDGEYGTSSAARVAKGMLLSFPNVRIGLMVGIAGGAPSQKHDIRLGDIVVSAPRHGKGGVFQYDFGKKIQGQELQPTLFLDQPPEILRAAMGGIKAQYKIKGHQLEEAINGILEKKPRLRQDYKRPEPSTDKLFKAEITHDLACAMVCGDNTSNLILRPERTKDEDNPAIHYGLVASANQLMKDALARDKLAAENDILCFEMEAAGLMNHFPCLVIRGICDYSDSHKNKDWQGYAAMAAAAYAKDLLCRMAPNRVEAEKKISDILSGIREAQEEQQDITKKQLQAQKEQLQAQKEQLQAQRDLAKEMLSKEEQQCLQLFRLTERNTTYEWYKNRVEDRVEGTCRWFLEHKHFQMWLKQESGPLVVSADPGCGKSVLAKYLIDDVLPQSITNSTTICYFFFKDQDQNTVRQALCALLHQLFSQKPSLIEHAMTQFRNDGQGLTNSTESLWKVLRNAMKDPLTGPVIMVLDALDECAESEFADLMRNVESQFRSDQLGHGKLKYLLTCRPYEQIVSKFRGLLDAFPNIRIPGEEESETISQEVNRVVTHRVNLLSEKKCLSPQIKSHLEKRLQETTHRTYLWVYLVFDYLEKEDFKKTLKGVESTIATLPRSIHEAYEQILNKSKEHPMVRKALSIILAAGRPLTLSEMNIAVNIDATSQSIHDLDLENEKDFRSRLRSCTRHAHTILAELCVLYLNLFNSDISLPIDTIGEAGYSVDNQAFLDYSAEYWGAHFREAGIIDGTAIMSSVLKICDPDSKSYSVWFRIYWKTTGMAPTDYFTDLMVASYYGHRAVVKLLLEKGAEIEAKDTEYRRTPLWWATEKGYEAVVKLLVENGADVESKESKDGRTPLWQATEYGYEAIVKLLLKYGADVETKDSMDGLTPLSLASEQGHEAIVRLLLEKGAYIESKDEDGLTPLSLAAENGHLATVKHLREASGVIPPPVQFGPLFHSNAVPATDMDPSMHWAENIFSHPLPSRTVFGHQQVSFNDDQISLTVYLDGWSISPYLQLRIFDQGTQLFSVRGVHELCIERDGNALQLRQWSRAERRKSLWAVLCFMTWEELVLMHHTFVSLKANSKLTIKLGPRERILDDGFDHSLIVYEYGPARALRLHAVVGSGRLRQCPVWTAFVACQSVSTTLIKRVCCHRIRLADVQLYVFCREYQQQNQRRGCAGDFEIEFFRDEAARRFEDLFYPPKADPAAVAVNGV
ncbi:hypothetical protein DL769_008749 [Monosporascus sp. CRB-8-3]|nr:hypothetical protein DL769_008749 [Monosporascus sp. CRB-8-3]